MSRLLERANQSNQSNQRDEQPQRCNAKGALPTCPRRESNPHLRFRKPSFYPLNYGDKWIFEFRFSNADCPELSIEVSNRTPNRLRSEILTAHSEFRLPVRSSG